MLFGIPKALRWFLLFGVVKYLQCNHENAMEERNYKTQFHGKTVHHIDCDDWLSWFPNFCLPLFQEWTLLFYTLSSTNPYERYDDATYARLVTSHPHPLTHTHTHTNTHTHTPSSVSSNTQYPLETMMKGTSHVKIGNRQLGFITDNMNEA
jgi:hypothetical protein